MIYMSGGGGTILVVNGTTFHAGHAMTQAINWTASGSYAQLNLTNILGYNGNGLLPKLSNTLTLSRGIHVDDFEVNSGAGYSLTGTPQVFGGGIESSTSGGAPMLHLNDTTIGAVAPHKFLRVSGGSLEFLNSDYSRVIASLTDTGALTSSQYRSSIPNGTAPFIVNSSTPVSKMVVAAHPTVLYCGNTESCSHITQSQAKIAYGTVTLSSGTATVTGITPAFTSTTTFACTVTNTSSLSPLKVHNLSASSIRISSPESQDVVNYSCIGI
jgi:hypothetical protein